MILIFRILFVYQVTLTLWRLWWGKRTILRLVISIVCALSFVYTVQLLYNYVIVLIDVWTGKKPQ